MECFGVNDRWSIWNTLKLYWSLYIILIDCFFSWVSFFLHWTLFEYDGSYLKTFNFLLYLVSSWMFAIEISLGLKAIWRNLICIQEVSLETIHFMSVFLIALCMPNHVCTPIVNHELLFCHILQFMCCCGIIEVHRNLYYNYLLFLLISS